MQMRIGLTARRTIAAACSAMLIAGMLPLAAAAEGAAEHAASGGGSTEPRAALAAQSAEARQADAYRIVALGDSLTAGYEYGMDKQDNPVPYGFTERMYEQALFQGLRAEYRNYGIIGLKADDMRKFLAAVEKEANLEAADVLDTTHPSYTDPRARAVAEAIVGDGKAVRKALADADLILIQIGGNDFKAYADILADGTEPERRLTELLNAYAAALEASVRTVFAINPDVQVVIGDQYSPIPEKVLNEPQRYYAEFQAAAAQLTAGLEALASKLRDEDYRVTVAHPAEKFQGKELSYTALLASTASGDTPDIHPNQNGYAAMAEAYAEAVWGEYRKPAKRPEGVPLTVVVNGKELDSENKPLLRNDYSYLPLADISAALGAAKGWDNKTKTASLTLGNRKAELTLDQKTMLVNGRPIAIPAAPFIHNERTYVPVGALSDALGFEVIFRNTLKTVFING